jgi:hypothetical protein
VGSGSDKIIREAAEGGAGLDYSQNEFLTSHSAQQATLRFVQIAHPNDW